MCRQPCVRPDRVRVHVSVCVCVCTCALNSTAECRGICCDTNVVCTIPTHLHFSSHPCSGYVSSTDSFAIHLFLEPRIWKN